MPLSSTDVWGEMVEPSVATWVLGEKQKKPLPQWLSAASPQGSSSLSTLSSLW